MLTSMPKRQVPYRTWNKRRQKNKDQLRQLDETFTCVHHHTGKLLKRTATNASRRIGLSIWAYLAYAALAYVNGLRSLIASTCQLMMTMTHRPTYVTGVKLNCFSVFFTWSQLYLALLRYLKNIMTLKFRLWVTRLTCEFIRDLYIAQLYRPEALLNR